MNIWKCRASRHMKNLVSVIIANCAILLEAHGAFAVNWIMYPVDTSGHAGPLSSIAIDNQGRPHIVYCRTNTSTLMYAYYDQAAGWIVESTGAQLKPTAQPSIALDSINRPHVAFYCEAVTSLGYATRSAGLWSYHLADNLGKAGFYCSIGIGTGDKPYIAYNDYTDLSPNQQKLKLAVMPTWGLWTREVVDTGYLYGQYCSLSVENQTPHIIYNGGGTIRYATKAAGTWLTSFVDNFTLYSRTSVKAVNGSVYAAYRNIGVRYAQKSANTWNIEDAPLVVDMGQIAMAMDTVLRPHMVCIYGGNVLYARRMVSGWEIETVDNSGNAAGPSIAVDRHHRAHISYYDYNTKRLIYTKRVLADGLAPNDYDGDSISDLAVYHPSSANWYIRSPVSVTPIVWQKAWGFAGCTPVPEDYNGDGYCDLAVFCPTTAAWFVRSVGGAPIAWNLKWGLKDCLPAPGDYDGDRAADLAVFYPPTGKWYIRSLQYSTPIAWGQNWGFSGCLPAPGDYDGDGRDDLAVFHPASGKWYIRSLAGNTIAWGVNWGWAGCVPVPGDYNGDGRDDLAVYHATKALWFIKDIASPKAIVWNQQWKFPGSLAVPGDYDGNGVADLCTYIASTGPGEWLAETSRSLTTIMWGVLWGWSETIPADAAGQ